MEPALRKGKPIGDGSRLESGRALRLPCEFDSRSFRCNRKLCHWPIGKGASLPSWIGGFDSRMALSMKPIRGSANGRLPDFESGDRGSNPLPRACEVRADITLVLWPSGEGTCLTNRGSTVRIRPGLLKQHGPSVQSGVDATLSRWRSPVQIRYGSLTWCGTPTAERRVCALRDSPCYWKRIRRNNTARSSIGRTPVSHAGKMSSILIRVTRQR